MLFAYSQFAVDGGGIGNDPALYLNCLHDPTINKGTTIDERVKIGEKLYKQ